MNHGKYSACVAAMCDGLTNKYTSLLMSSKLLIGGVFLLLLIKVRKVYSPGRVFILRNGTFPVIVPHNAYTFIYQSGIYEGKFQTFRLQSAYAIICVLGGFLSRDQASQKLKILK